MKLKISHDELKFDRAEISTENWSNSKLNVAHNNQLCVGAFLNDFDQKFKWFESSIKILKQNLEISHMSKTAKMSQIRSKLSQILIRYFGP